MEIDAWNHFKIEHPYIVRKSKKKKSLDPRAHLPCRGNCMLPIVAANQSACFSFSASSAPNAVKKALE